jgi:hypothetical protein
VRGNENWENAIGMGMGYYYDYDEWINWIFNGSEF